MEVADLTGSPTRPRLPLTLDVQLGGVLGEALQADLLPDQGEELVEGGAGLLVVVHLLLRALASLAVEDPHFVFPAELQKRERLNGGRPGTDVRGNRTNRAFSGAEPGELLGSQENSAPEPERKEKGLGACPSCPSTSLPFQRRMTRCPCCLFSSSWQRAMLLSRVRETVCLGRLPSVGELKVAKALRREILKGSVELTLFLGGGSPVTMFVRCSPDSSGHW